MRNTIRPRSGFRQIAGIALAATLLLLTACASAPKMPNAAFAEARVAISTAEKADASNFAGAELREARLKLAQADDAVADEQMTRADQLARESRAAAELATALTETAKAKAVNLELSKGLKALNEELNRPGDDG